jgi:hypothetical protein
MLALVTSSKVILLITLGIPVVLGLLAAAAVMIRPKR